MTDALAAHGPHYLVSAYRLSGEEAHVYCMGRVAAMAAVSRFFERGFVVCRRQTVRRRAVNHARA